MLARGEDPPPPPPPGTGPGAGPPPPPPPRAPTPRAADAGSLPVSQPEGAGFPAAAPATALTIDALGRKCPIPIIMLAEQIGGIPLGAVAAVLADDPAAYTDIPSWCTMKAHEFVGHQ